MKTINRFEAAFLTEKDVSEFTEPRYGFNEFLAKYSCISPKRFMSLFAKKANSDGFHRTVRFDQLSRHAVDSFGNKSDYIFEFTGLEYVPCKIEE